MSEVLAERVGAAVVVTLNRPRRRNALDAAAKAQLHTTLAQAAADEGVRAVLLTGAGDAFCVGQDLAEHAEALRADPAHAFDTVERDYAPIVRLLATMDKPVVAAVNGTCVGAGLALALACDLRVFAEDAVLATAFTAIGLTCDSGLSATLAAAVGVSRARELVLRGTSFTPADALTWGVSGTVVARADVDAAGRALVAELAGGPTAAYAATKRLFAGALDAALAAESREQAALGLTADHAGAVEAFLSKQKPTFSGR
ncbi:enoyl-CoA hydratase/isomerase family protein [Cryptosporangium aurantiacum]|uniref:2-(1,2-epoxy-1,2-dihydrophenyl)acetyl-CoA isomerase n=1 Tax=Cryptosporangium aurantiacum TaxID=134849 RepID=A0A1M7RNF4_9ACTN|nr:enoyl-CoA hydratase-related protein [Cryptosporangium aurantiacum]SHN47739.1 2-(1,2-epoxy-1,2-dihydrophenyl)acetyl-CoA isomerase [Cryptosporangium aurantiacum]